MTTQKLHKANKALPVVIDRDLDTVVRQPIPHTSKQQLESVRAIKHFVTVQKMGYNPRLLCWCGEAIPLDYTRGYEIMTSRLNAYLDIHADCPPPVSKS